MKMFNAKVFKYFKVYFKYFKYFNQTKVKIKVVRRRNVFLSNEVSWVMSEYSH